MLANPAGRCAVLAVLQWPTCKKLACRASGGYEPGVSGHTQHPLCVVQGRRLPLDKLVASHIHVHVVVRE